MNKQRRKDIDAIIERLESIREEIITVRDEEQDYLDNIPKNLQNSERYEIADNAVRELDDAEASLDDIIEHLTSARDGW